MATAALTIDASGDLADAYGLNDIKVNDNVLTVYINGGNNRLFQFSGVKELYGNNNKTYRPYQTTTSNDNPGNAQHNFLWWKVKHNVGDATNNNLQLSNTLDNGWPTSRLVSYHPTTNPQYSYLPFDGSLTGTNVSLTWIDNPNPTPSASPWITSVSMASPYTLEVSVSEPNSLPVRVMVLHNGLPLGLKDVVGNTLSIPLNRMAKIGDVFVVKVFNQNGQFFEQTCPYNPIDDSREFVRRHYLDFLLREPDQAGWDYWTGQITQCGNPGFRLPGETETQCIGRKRVDVSRAFWYAPEFQQQPRAASLGNPLPPPDFNNREFVRLCYLVYLQREPDQAGWDFWTNELNLDTANGVGYDHLITAFVVSPAYRLRFGQPCGN